MKPPPGNVRVFACGASGSGKTETLKALWLTDTPRALVLDVTGEHQGMQGALLADSWRALLRTLARVGGRPRWRIVAALDAGEMEQLARLLLPSKLARERSLAWVMGGLALMSDEVAAWAGHNAPESVLDLWRRGRHVGLSIYAATQRPADCARIVTSQSRWLAICAIHEPRDLAYLKGKLPAPVFAWLDTLPRYGCILWHNERRCGLLLDAARRPIARFGPP